MEGMIMLELKQGTYYTVREVSQMLGVSVGRVHQYICTGRIASEKIGSARFVPETEVKRIIAERRGDKRCKWPLGVE